MVQRKKGRVTLELKIFRGEPEAALKHVSLSEFAEFEFGLLSNCVHDPTISTRSYTRISGQRM
jgi:hypothetical protein